MAVQCSSHARPLYRATFIFSDDVCKQYFFFFPQWTKQRIRQLTTSHSYILRANEISAFNCSIMNWIILYNLANCYLCLQTFALILFQFLKKIWFVSACIVCVAACAARTSENLSVCNKALCIRCKAALNISQSAQWVTSLAGCCKEATNGEGNGSAHFLWKGITFLIYH